MPDFAVYSQTLQQQPVQIFMPIVSHEECSQEPGSIQYFPCSEHLLTTHDQLNVKHSNGGILQNRGIIKYHSNYEMFFAGPVPILIGTVPAFAYCSSSQSIIVVQHIDSICCDMTKISFM